MSRITMAICLALALTGSLLVANAAADPKPASAHTKCQSSYVRGVVGYQTTKVTPTGPQDPGVRPDYSRPIYGPVWTTQCGIPHNHWYQVLVCSVAGAGVAAATGGVTGAAVGAATTVTCVQVLKHL